MNTPIKPEQNRVGADLDIWKKLEQHFAKRHGPDIWNDRESQKVKADMYRHIIKKHAGTPKNDIERAELKMLRAQHRQMIKKLYPNPWVRLARNSSLLVLNVAATGAKQLFKLLKFLVNPTMASQQPAASPRQTAPAPQPVTGPQQTAGQQQAKTTGVKNGASQRGTQTRASGQRPADGRQQTGKQQQPAAKQAIRPQGATAKVRNLNPRQMVSPGTSKGMRRG